MGYSIVNHQGYLPWLKQQMQIHNEVDLCRLTSRFKCLKRQGKKEKKNAFRMLWLYQQGCDTTYKEKCLFQHVAAMFQAVLKLCFTHGNNWLSSAVHSNHHKKKRHKTNKKKIKSFIFWSTRRCVNLAGRLLKPGMKWTVHPCAPVVIIPLQSAYKRTN